MQEWGTGHVKHCLCTAMPSLFWEACIQLDQLLATGEPLAPWHTGQRELHFPCVGNHQDAALQTSGKPSAPLFQL